MNSNDEMYGTLLFFRRDGRAGTNYPLCGGKTTIGSSTEADIRLKLNDDRLELIHCVIDVNQNGIATLVNQSVAAPVKVNTINVRKYKVLNHEDRIELIGKQFQYLNEVISVEDVEKQKKTLSQVLLTPSRQRKSIAPLIRNSKNTPTLKTKTPTQRRTTVRKSIAGSGAEFVTSLTPISKSNRSGIKEKFKTTSKVVVSKALGSSKSSRRRRLSLGNNPKESGNTPKVSARNIVLSKGVVSSTTTEENRDLIKPSVSMKYLDTLCENAGFLDETNNSIKTLDDSPPQRRASLKTPSKSSARIHVSEATPKIATPVNKRMESFKTPLSLKKSSPLFKSSPKALSVKRTLNTSEDVNTPIRVLKKSTVNKNSLVSSPKIIGRNTPKLSARKRNRKSGHNESKEIIETVEELVQPKSAKRNSRRHGIVDENFFSQYTPKNIPSRSSLARKKLASSDSETGSQFEEVALNLSSSSSVSPLTKNGGISSDDASPRRSVLKKALGKSQMRAVSSSDRRQSSTIGAIESPGLRKSSRRSSLHEASMADCQQELQKNGHPKEAFARKSVLRNSSVIEKDQEMSRFAKKSRQSLKLADSEELLNVSKQSTAYEVSPKVAAIRKSGRRSSLPIIDGNECVSRSHTPLRRSKLVEQPTLVSDEESLHFSLLETSPRTNFENNASKRSSILYKEAVSSPQKVNRRKLLRRSSLLMVDEKSRQSKLPTEESLHFSLLETQSPNVSNTSQGVRQSLRRSRTKTTTPNNSFTTDSSKNVEGSLSERRPFRRSDETDQSDDSLHVNLSVHRSQSTSKQSLRQSNALERASLTKSRTSKRKSKANDKYFGEDYITGSSVNKSLKSTNGKNFNEEQNSQLLSSEDSLHLNLSSDDDSPLHAETSLNESIKSQRPNTVSSIGRLSRTSSVKRVDEDTNSYENPQSEEERDSDGDEFIKRRSSAKKSFEYQKSSINRSNRMIDGEAETSFDNISRRSSYRINTASGSSKTYDNDSVQPVSEDESVYSLETSDDSQSVRSMVRKTALSTRSEYDTSEAETSTNKSTSKRGSLIKSTPLNKSQRTSLDASAQNISVITLNDSNDSTPENHTSIIFLDTPFDKSQQNKSKHRRSKTLNSTIQEALELATPKSVLKNRRSKSAVYKPITEDITLVSPLEESRTESGFKTPLNTPGLFENIKKSVLKSRSRVQRSNSSLMEELNKAECGRKRRRSWSVGSVRSAKRKKMEGMSESSVVSDSEYQSSIDSFSTDEVLSDIADQNVVHTTPRHFSDLTDKPLINEPKTRSLSEPKRVKSTAARRSLHAMRLESKITPVNSKNSEDVISATFISSQEDDSVFGESFDSNVSSRKSSRRSSLPNQSPDSTPDGSKGDKQSTKNDLGVKKTPKIVKSPKNDLMNIVGFKKIFNTPKEQSSPVNNLTKIPNLRTFFSPKQNKSPKNDLSDVAGLKKLLATPKQMKSPENDLRKIPNLRRFMSLKHQNSPKNDLSDVAGVKKLLSTPKTQNSPKNDLTNVPNLRGIMSPKQQNSPRNDLEDVRGLKKLMKTPRKIKEPQNDLSDVEGVTNIFNVSGVQRLSNESDIENNEDLFEKLFAKKTLKTYRGRSLSPTTRKTIIFSGDTRKTLGDVSLASPRVKKWVEEQAIIKSRRNSNESLKGVHLKEDLDEQGLVETIEAARRTPRGKRKIEDDKPIQEKTKTGPRGRRRIEELVNAERTESPKRSPRGRKRLVDTPEQNDVVLCETTEETKFPRGTRNRPKDLGCDGKTDSPKRTPRGGKKLVEKEEKPEKTTDEEVQEEKVATKPGRGRRRVEQLVEEAKQESPKKSPRGRKKAQLVEEKLVETITELTGTVDEEIEFKVKKPTRGRGKANKNTKQIADAHEEDSSSNNAVFKVPSVKATRSKRAPKKENNEDQVAEVHSTTGDINSPAPRANKIDDSDDGADSKIVIVPKRRGRPRKIRPEEAVNSSEKSEVRRGQLENVPKEETLPKARGRKRVASKNDNLIEVPIDCKVVLEELPLKRTGRKKIIEEEALSESPVVPQKSIKRGRKQVISDADSENIEKELSDELVKIGKTRGRPKAQLQRPQETGDDVEEAESAKPTRGRRRGANQQLDEEETKVDVAKKQTRGRKVDSEKLGENTRNKGGKEDQPLKETADEVEFENVEPVKSSRNRREKKNQPIEEAVEVKVPAKTGKRPRGKALEEAVVVDVDSPRTVRLRRGNFKKYGIEFVVDSEEMSDTGLKKKVHFNDNADDGEKKRNRRNVEEVEEATRRSKRTRK